MAEVVLALGSNLGDSRSNLKQALGYLQRLGSIEHVAPLYRTSPYGFQDQPDFLNTVLILDTSLKPVPLLRSLKKIEEKLGRTKHLRWGPREIDLDIIFYDQLTFATEELTIPHRDVQNRRFVLLPLVHIEPDWYSPQHEATVSELLEQCNDDTEIELLDINWYTNGS